MKNIKNFLKKHFAWFKPIYHGVYIFFLVLELLTFLYYYMEFHHYQISFRYLDIFIKWCKMIEWCEISTEIASFNSMMTMQAICAAIIIFLYTKYSEGIQGIRSEYFIEHKVGEKTVSTYRITSLILPWVSLVFNGLHWYGSAVVTAVFMYYIICIYVILIAFLMRRDKISNLIKKMVYKEISSMEEKLNCYITKEISGGYFIVISEAYKRFQPNMQKKKMQLQNKGQVYQELKSRIIGWAFNENNLYELSLTVQDICEAISELSTKNVIINYIYMYDLVVAILNVDLNVTKSWRVALIDKIFITLDKKSDINKDSPYEVLYFAVICAVLQHGTKNEKDYLWFCFFETQRKRNAQIAKRLFVFSLGFLELLRRTNKEDKHFRKMVKTYHDKFKIALDFIKESFDDYEFSTVYNRYCIVLSLIGCGTEEYIKKCYKEVCMDLNNIENKNYFIKTMIRII